LVVIPLCLAKDESLYTESEAWTFHAPLADEVLERLFGFYDYFDDLCFFFPKSFINPTKVSDQLDGPGLSLSKMGDDNSRVVFPSELNLKTPVDSLVYHTLFDPDWVKYLPKVIKHKKEEDVSSLSEPEYERDQAPDQDLAEPNHDPCEDCEEFEFDKTGARVNKSYRDPYKKFAEGVDVCVSDDWVCTPHPSSSSPSPSSVPSFSFSSPSDIPPNLPSTPSNLPSRKTSSILSSSSSVISKFSNVFSCCQVGPPDEDIELLLHLSHKFLNPPVSVVNESKVNGKKNENDLSMEETIVPSNVNKLRARKVKRDDDDNEFLDMEVCKRSVICDDDEESDEKKKKRNLKRELMNLNGSRLILGRVPFLLIRVEKSSLQRPL
jgi:hypothetical protein